MSRIDDAWKELIAEALRRNVVVAVEKHRAAVEAAVRAAPALDARSAAGDARVGRPIPALTGRDIHREWRDGMLAQGRAVAPERMAWDTLDQRDRDLDDGIAARLSGTNLHGYTCDLCEWGRDSLKGVADYAVHLRREHCAPAPALDAERLRRERIAGMRDALIAVGMLNGNGRDEPSDPALDAAEDRIRRMILWGLNLIRSQEAIAAAYAAQEPDHD